MNESQEMVPIIIVVIYLGILLGLGVLGYVRSRQGEEDYYLAGRQQGWWITGLTIIATFFSSFAFLGAPGLVYREGVVFTLFALNVPLAGAAVYLLGAPIREVGRAKGYVTPGDMIADYYQSQVALRLLVALTGFLYAIPYIMMQIKAGGEISAVLFGDFSLDLGGLGQFDAFQVGSIVLALITMIYIMVGGMRSVAWTDALQGMLLIGGMLLGGYAVVAAFGGWAGFGVALSRLSDEALTSPGRTGGYPWTKMLTICLFASVGSLVQPAQWMRFYAASSRSTLRRGALMFAISLPPCFLLGVMLVGLGGQALYPLEGTGAAALPSADVGAFDRILIVVLNDQLPRLLGPAVGASLASLLIVAVMAASMSTADSNLHALSAVTVRDIYDRFLRPKSSEVERVWVGRLVIVVATLAALVLVLRTPDNTGAASGFDFMRMIALLGLAAIAFSVQLVPLTIDMLYVRKGTARGAICGLSAGLLGAFASGPMFAVVSGYLNAIPGVSSVIALWQSMQIAVPMDSTAWGLLFNVPVFVLVSRWTRPVPEAMRSEYERLISGGR